MGRLGVTDPTTGAQLRGQVSAGAPLQGPANLDYLWEGDNVVRFGGTAKDKIDAYNAGTQANRAPYQNLADLTQSRRNMADVEQTPSRIDLNRANATQARAQASTAPSQQAANYAKADESKAKTTQLTQQNARLKQWEQLYKDGRIDEDTLLNVRNASNLAAPKQINVLKKGLGKISDYEPARDMKGELFRDKQGNVIYRNRKTRKSINAANMFDRQTIGGKKAGDTSVRDALQRQLLED